MNAHQQLLARAYNEVREFRGLGTIGFANLEPYHSVPHARDNKYLVHWDERCSYIADLIEQIGRERFVILSNCLVYARDDEALTLWNLGYDETQEQESLLRMFGCS